MAATAARIGDPPEFEALSGQRIYEYDAAATGYRGAEFFTAARTSESTSAAR